MTSRIIFLIIFLYSLSVNAQQDTIFNDDFEEGSDGWIFSDSENIQIINSSDSTHGQVLSLTPNGTNIYALVKDSEDWTNIKIEGDVLFPTNSHCYMGLIYNFSTTGSRTDYGCIYIKGNGSYLAVNPHRDGNASRVLYEEYHTDLTGDAAITIGQWQNFKVEVIDSVCHFYVGDTITPQLTFRFYEFNSGGIGIKPRISGVECWVDNIVVTTISEFNYQGKPIPDIVYQPDKLITDLSYVGPFSQRIPELESNVSNPGYQWQPFQTDGRGCILSGKICEYESGNRKYVYFLTSLFMGENKKVKLLSSTTNNLTIWVNSELAGTIPRHDEAWYDFLYNSAHQSEELEIDLESGYDSLLILCEGGIYAGDGFYLAIDTNSAYINGDLNHITDEFFVCQSNPNPFYRSTQIKYNLSKSEYITLKIFSPIGQEIETLISDFQTTGEHHINWTTENLSRGIYFYQLQAGNISKTKKMILEK